MRTLLTAGAATMALLAFPSAARAQLPVGGAAATTIAAAPAAAKRTVATYRFHGTRRVALPAEVTLADSAGALVASYRFIGQRESHSMTVTVMDTDIVLQGDGPEGVITLRLDRQNDAAPGDVLTGRWWVDDAQGTLRGRMMR